MSESGFQKVTREGIERSITDAANAGDSNLANDQLDKWPTGHSRKEISLEAAHHIAGQCAPVARVIALGDWRKAA